MKKILFRIAFVALIIRFAYFLQHAASPFFARPLLDQKYYDLCARQLAGAGGDLIDGFRPLRYPVFLSGVYMLDLDGGMILSIIAHVWSPAKPLLSLSLTIASLEKTNGP